VHCFYTASILKEHFNFFWGGGRIYNIYVISNFRREVDEIWAQGQEVQDGTDMFSGNGGEELPLYAVW